MFAEIDLKWAKQYRLAIEYNYWMIDLEVA